MGQRSWRRRAAHGADSFDDGDRLALAELIVVQRESTDAALLRNFEHNPRRPGFGWAPSKAGQALPTDKQMAKNGLSRQTDKQTNKSLSVLTGGPTDNEIY